MGPVQRGEAYLALLGGHMCNSLGFPRVRVPCILWRLRGSARNRDWSEQAQKGAATSRSTWLPRGWGLGRGCGLYIRALRLLPTLSFGVLWLK